MNVMRLFRDRVLPAYSGLPAGVWMLALVAFVNRSGSMVLFFLPLYLKEAQGIRPDTIGELVATYGVGALLSGLLSGWLCDRVSPKRIQVSCLLLNGVGFMLLPLAEGALGIALALLAVSLAAEGFRPANATALARLAPPAVRTRAFALNRLAVNLGVTIGPAVGGVLSEHGFVWIFLADGATCLVAGLILLRCVEVPPTATTAAGEERAPPARGPLADRHFLFVLSGTFGVALVFMQLMSTYPLYLREVAGLEKRHIGVLLALNTVVIVLVEMPLVHALRSRRELRVIAAGAAFMALGFGAMPFGSGAAFLALTVLVWTVGEMLSIPLLAAYVAHAAPEAARGRYLGLFNAAFSLACLVAPIAGTRIYDDFAPDGVWHAALGVGLAAALVFAASDRARRRRGAPAPATDPAPLAALPGECQEAGPPRLAPDAAAP